MHASGPANEKQYIFLTGKLPSRKTIVIEYIYICILVAQLLVCWIIVVLQNWYVITGNELFYHWSQFEYIGQIIVWLHSNVSWYFHNHLMIWQWVFSPGIKWLSRQASVGVAVVCGVGSIEAIPSSNTASCWADTADCVHEGIIGNHNLSVWCSHTDQLPQLYTSPDRRKTGVIAARFHFNTINSIERGTRGQAGPSGVN